LTQAAVSQRIRALEGDLGVALFRRAAGRVTLTPAGERLHGFARQILQLYQQARREVAAQVVPLGGELTVAASSVPGEHLLPAAVSDFHRRFAHVQVKVTVADSLAVLHQVEHGQAQLGVVGWQVERPHLAYQPLGADRMVLVVPARHPWRRRREVTLPELATQPLVLREAGSGSRSCLEQAVGAAGRSAGSLNVALELGSNEAVKEAVLRGAGVAVLSTYAVRRELKAKKLHALSVAGLSLERQFYLVHDRRRPLPLPAQLFRDFLLASNK
jgi:DNA-binding transcriptional LysR family regulator